MHENDAEMMLDILSKNNKDKTGANLLSVNAPSPNEIWATLVAINDKLNDLDSEIDELQEAQVPSPGPVAQDDPGPGAKADPNL